MKLFKIAMFAISMSAFSLAQIAFADDQLQTIADDTSHAYPTALNKRPFTLPQGSVEASGDMKFQNFAAETVGAVAPDIASLNSLGVKVGVTDDLTFGLSWGGFQIPKMNPAKSINTGIGYFVGANKYFATMVSLDVPFHFEADVVHNVSFAAPTVFGIVKDVSVLAFYDGLVDFHFANKSYSASFNLPVKLGYQATDRLALDVSTTLATFHVGGAKDHSYIWQAAPVNVGALYAITNAFDVVGRVGFSDVAKPKDSFAFTLGLNYRIGILDA